MTPCDSMTRPIGWGDVTACIEISRSLVHTPHKFARTIHDWLDIWACEQCGTERTC